MASTASTIPIGYQITDLGPFYIPNTSLSSTYDAVSSVFLDNSTTQPSPAPSDETGLTPRTSNSYGSHRSQFPAMTYEEHIRIYNSIQQDHNATNNTIVSPTPPAFSSSVNNKVVLSQASQSTNASNSTKHTKKRSAVPKSNSTTAADPKIRAFLCKAPGCEKRFTKKWNLQAHGRMHTGYAPFQCRHNCGLRYMWMSSRKGHEMNRCALRDRNPNLHNPSVTQPRRRRRKDKTSGTVPSRTESCVSQATSAFSTTVSNTGIFKGRKADRTTTKRLFVKNGTSEQQKASKLQIMEELMLLKEGEVFDEPRNECTDKLECVSSVTDDLLDDSQTDISKECTGDIDILGEVSLGDRFFFSEGFVQRVVFGHDYDSKLI